MDAGSQVLLGLMYRDLLASGRPLPRFRDTGFKVFSQTDEDGLLLYIFSLIGAEKRTAVEICAGNGIECNAANLIVNHGWHALLVDGNAERVERGRTYYREHRWTYVYPPSFVQAWITRDNVNEVISSNGFSGEVGLLSIDLDGVDYWIWEAIQVIEPRVVVVEYQDIIGPDRALTVPYSDDFDAWIHPMTDGTPNYFGASLPAFVKLASRKGYRLVGCNRLGYNAFFVRRGLCDDELPEIAARECFSHTKVIEGMRDRFPTVKDYPWVEV
ncbi:MAG TPA: hypothetical protein VF701_04510 [Thermoanaerobaculia bacterium]